MQDDPLTERQAIDARADLLKVESQLLEQMRAYDSERAFRDARLKLITWIGLFSFVSVVGAAVIAYVGADRILTTLTDELVADAIEKNFGDRIADQEKKLVAFDRIRETEGYLTSGGVDAYLSRTLYNMDSFSEVCVAPGTEPPEIYEVRLHFAWPFSVNGGDFDMLSLRNKIGPFHAEGGTDSVHEVFCYVHEGFWNVSSPRTPYFQDSAEMPPVVGISFADVGLVDSSGVHVSSEDENKFRAYWSKVEALRIWLGVNGRSGLIMMNPGKLVEEDGDLFDEDRINLIEKLEFRERTDRIGRVSLDAVFVLKEPLALLDIIQD